MPLSLTMARAALGSAAPLWPGMPRRRFRMTLDWPGQEGQAKCITRVDEETTR
jgi:CRISPR-associated protein Csx14